SLPHFESGPTHSGPSFCRARRDFVAYPLGQGPRDRVRGKLPSINNEGCDSPFQKFLVTPSPSKMSCGQKTRHGRCLEIIAQRTLLKSDTKASKQDIRFPRRRLRCRRPVVARRARGPTVRDGFL